jgi:hypothetical protein
MPEIADDACDVTLLNEGVFGIADCALRANPDIFGIAIPINIM